MFHVHILRGAGGRHYIGQTGHLEGRLPDRPQAG